MSNRAWEALAHVYWIGGSACAGKTAVADLLAKGAGLDVYHCDEHFRAHRDRVDPQRHPYFTSIMERTPEELWMRPLAEQVAELLGFYAEELEMLVDDLTQRGRGEILVEGAGLVPARLAELTQRPRAVWLVATPGFRRRHYPERGPWVRELLEACSDPERAWRRWMERDDRFAAAVKRQAQRLGGRVIEVDGRHGVEQVASDVARGLGLYLGGRALRRAP